MEPQTIVLKRLNDPLDHNAPASAVGSAMGVVQLGRGARGLRGVVTSVGVGSARRSGGELQSAELERRLLEIGFVEGAQIEILHEGAIGGDPIAVRIDDARVALRRREADSVLVRVEAGRLRRQSARAA